MKMTGHPILEDRVAVINHVWKLLGQLKDTPDVFKTQDGKGAFYQTPEGFFAGEVLDHVSAGQMDQNGNILWEVLAAGDFFVPVMRGISEEQFLRTNFKGRTVPSIQKVLYSRFALILEQVKQDYNKIYSPNPNVNIFSNGDLWVYHYKEDDSYTIGSNGMDWAATMGQDKTVNLKGIGIPEFLLP